MRGNHNHFLLLGTVAVGGDASVVIKVLPSQAGNITDTASVSGSLSDPDLANNENPRYGYRLYRARGREEADLSITKRATAVRSVSGRSSPTN